MTFYPPPKGKIFDLNGYPVKNGLSGENEYSLNKSANFVVFNAVSDRSVIFRAFIESFSIDTSFEIEETGGGGSTLYYNKGTGIVYNIKLIVPSNSVNDSMNNLARFAELERMLSISLDQATSLAGRSAIVQANTYFCLNNLIQDGLFNIGEGKDTINKENGIPGVVQDISFEPDLEQGFFEFNNRFLAKAYSLNLKIQLIADDGDVRYVKGFDSNGQWTENSLELDEEKRTPSIYKNTRYWPFGIKVTNDAGFFTLDDINANNFNATDSYATNKGAFLGIAKKVNEDPLKKWVVFKSFLNSFTYAKKNEIAEIEDSTMVAGKLFNFTGDKKYEWNLSIVVPNHSVNEAIRNLAKINVLYRMGILANPNVGVGNNGSDVYVKLSNLIFNPKAGNSLNYSCSSIINEGLLCKMTSIGLNINTEMGFFEYDNHFLPKEFELTIGLKYIDSNEWGSMVTFDNETGNIPSTDDIRWPHGMNYDNPAQPSPALEEVLEVLPAANVVGSFNAESGVLEVVDPILNNILQQPEISTPDTTPPDNDPIGDTDLGDAPGF